MAAQPGSVADATAALRRRRGRRRRELALRGAVIGCVAVALLVAFWVVWFSPVLALRVVQVEGVRVLTPQQVQQAASAPVGRPLVRVDTAAIERRVGALSATREVQVSRAWPRGVRIVVTERTPVIQRHGDQGWEWSDADGVVFVTRSARDGKLVELQAPGGTRLLKDAAVVASSLSPKLRQQTTHIAAQSPDTIVLHLTGGRRVVWGSAAESTQKSAVATALLPVEATVYDVSSPGNPTSR